MLRTSAILHYVDAAPFYLDLTATLSVNNTIEFGGSYRFDESIGGIFIWKTQGMDFGYSHILELENNIAQMSGTTHQLFMNFKHYN